MGCLHLRGTARAIDVGRVWVAFYSAWIELVLVHGMHTGRKSRTMQHGSIC